MQFGYTDATIEQPHRCDSFQFSPPAWAVSFSQELQDANPVVDGYDFDIGDLTHDLEVHRRPLYLYTSHG